MKTETIEDGLSVARLIDSLSVRIAADVKNPVFVGIHRRGVPLAKRLCDAVSGILYKRCPLGSLDISLYRDDLSEISYLPKINGTDLPFAVDGAQIILCDDVLYTGRTVRAALDSLIEFGRPDCVKLCVLVERNGRQLPIRADYAARNVGISEKSYVSVRLSEVDGEDGIDVVTKEGV